MSVQLDPGDHYPTPGLFAHLARPVGLALSPLLVAQGQQVRRKRTRLPNAPLPWSGTISAPKPLRLLGLGDSTIAGVGVDNPMLGLTAQIAKALYRELGRGVSWDSFGQRGITTRELHRDYLPEALDQTRQADVVIVSIGANDAKSLRSHRESARHLDAVLDTLHQRYPGAVVMVSSLPAFHLFESLPAPLRQVMSGQAKKIESTLRPLVEARPYALMSPPPPGYPPTFFADDGFHPGAEGYRIWAEFAVSDAVRRGAFSHLAHR